MKNSSKPYLTLSGKLGPPLSKDESLHVTDEFYNTLIASTGAFLSILGSWFLIHRAVISGSFWATLSFFLYGIGITSMFITSALHHGINGSPRVNHWLRQLDYITIFLTIAGSFTPFCLIHLRNPLGWTTLAITWTLAIIGMTLKALIPKIPKWVMLSFYIGMGWVAALIAQPILPFIHVRGLFFLFLGGVFFTGGGLIYYFEKPNPIPGRFGFHEIWHCCVLAGISSHFYIMVKYF